MFQLFKKRSFSELIGDTFTFFKMHGKHYYRNYFIVNGGFLLVLLVLVYFLMKVFFEGLYSNMAGINSGNNNFDVYINDNLTLIVSLGIFSAIAIIFLSLLSYAFPVVYLKLLEKKPDFETREIIDLLKNNAGKIIIFFIASIFIFIPIMLIVFAISFALIFLLIGIPLILIVIPAMMSWYSLSFYDYLSNDKGYFESIGTGFNLLRQKFWPTVGSTAIMYIIMQIAISFIAAIPYMIGIFSFVTAMDTQNQPTGPRAEQISFLMIMMGIAMVLSILANFFFQNFILVNQGIIYYSSREENENNTHKSEIDLIGTQSE